MSRPGVLGWDVGGAHLKAAAVSAAGELLAVTVLPCALWQGLHTLEAAVSTLATEFPLDTYRHVLTMTGEMCDLFAGREAGVQSILDWFGTRLGGLEYRVYGAACGLLPFTAATAAEVASMNWHASARAVARKLPDALFVDVGSTTTDVIPVRQGEPAMLGREDRTRLSSDELVYQGVVRTPVMALATRVPYRGQWQGLAAEYFATSADVFRLTGELPEGADLQETADGRGKTLAESAARLARMVGDDLDSETRPAITALAVHLAGLQRQRLAQAVERVEPSREIPLVGAGIGRFLVRQLAQDLGRPCIDFAEVLGISGSLAGAAGDNAAAVAVAWLGTELPWQ